MVAALVQDAADAVEIHVAMAQGDEVPAPAHIPKGDVGAQDAVASVEVQLDVLGVDVVDPVDEVAAEDHGVHALPQQVAGIEVDAHGGPVVEDLQQLLGGPVVKGDLGGMDLQRQLDAAGVVDVHDGAPQLLDLLIGGLDLFLGGLGEGVPQLPDGRAHEEGDDLDVHGLGGLGGVLHFLDAPLLNFRGLARQLRRREAVQPGIVGVRQGVADALSGQVVAQCPAAQAVFLERRLDLGHVGGVRGGALHIQVRGGELQALEAHLLGQPADLLQREVAPLNRKECNRSCHL